MKLSIVTTLYKSSPYIDEFYTRITKEAKKITDDYEIIFVDDGSPDDSLQKVIALYEKDTKVKAIELSRNFGHHKAIMTGLSHAKGDFVFLIDSDLEEEPELLGEFWKKLHNEESIDIVYGVQESRKGEWFERWSGRIYYKLFNFLSGVQIPEDVLIAKLMSKEFCNNLIKFKEKNIFLGGLVELTGHKQRALICKKKYKGTTTYTLAVKMKQFVNSVTAFSSKPLYYVFNFGLTVTIFSLFYIIYLVFHKFFLDISIDGWTSILVSVYFFGGCILFALGIIGIYISKIFEEVKNRPYTIIRNIWEK